MYLQDKNGSIENDELHGFLKDLMELVEEVSALKSIHTVKKSVE